MGAVSSCVKGVAPHRSENQHDTASKQEQKSTDGTHRTTAVPDTPFANGASTANHYLSRASSPNVRLQHEYRGGFHVNDELERISTLQSLDILDTPPCPKYDDITKLLCSILSAPIAQLSLVDSNRQWCKSIQGLDLKQIDRDIAFCAWVLLPKHPKALVVEDTHDDARFRDNPLVTGPPYIRFYAGSPLIASNGHRLGSLCVVDVKPRQLDTDQLALLCNFAEMAVREMEKDKLIGLQRGKSLAKEMTHFGMHRAAKALTSGLLVVDVRSPGWPVQFMNDQAAEFVGTDRDTAQGRSLWGFFKKPLSSQGRSQEDLYAQPVNEHLEFSIVACTTSSCKLSLTFRPASSDMMDEHMFSIGIPNFVEFMHCKEKALYFCFITTMEQGPLPNASPAGHAQVEEVGLKDHTPFPGVKLGPLVGKGSFGKVFRGIWNGNVVAIKIIEHFEQMHAIQEENTPHSQNLQTHLQQLSDSHPPGQQGQAGAQQPLQPGQNGFQHGLQDGQGAQQPQKQGQQGMDAQQVVLSHQAHMWHDHVGGCSPLLEAVLGHGLRHPNIVQTYKYATQAMRDREGPWHPLDLQRKSLSPPLTKHTYTPFHSDSQVPTNRGSRGPGWRNSKEREKQMTETWLLLEYCDSGSLQEGIEQGWFRTAPEADSLIGKPDLDSVLRTAREIADALCYLHQANILHGDLTGNNILLASSETDDRRFTVKIADFGLSRHASASTMDTETYGTVTHMPPELLMDGKLTKSADVYAFGVLLWEMYTGERPFAGMRHAQIIYYVTTLLKHPEFPPGTPPQLKELGDRCMHADKDQRISFQQLLPLLDALHRDLAPLDPTALQGTTATLQDQSMSRAMEQPKADG